MITENVYLCALGDTLHLYKANGWNSFNADIWFEKTSTVLVVFSD